MISAKSWCQTLTYLLTIAEHAMDQIPFVLTTIQQKVATVDEVLN
jgi:hypothetical protein